MNTIINFSDIKFSSIKLEDAKLNLTTISFETFEPQQQLKFNIPEDIFSSLDELLNYHF